MAAFRSGKDAWNRFEPIDAADALQAQYQENWAMYAGTYLNETWKRSRLRSDAIIYRNANLLLKHTEGTADYYAATVYSGDLSTDGQPLPNGVLDAIPIDPQTGDDAQNEIIRVAVGELNSAWNWKQNMSQRPLFAAVLGDVLTELVDDLDKEFVYPSIVWPGYVKQIELDYVGNVKFYAIEYRVVETDNFGKASSSYRFRKEVSSEEFRYYRDGEPYDQFGEGAVVPNIYGFVPAIWDRHRVLWDERGGCAFSGTKQALIQVNSLLSHGFDFQRKAFLAPIMVKGQFVKPKQGRIQLGKPQSMDEVQAQMDQARIADSIGVVPIVGENVQLLQPQFDIGHTREIIKDIYEGILNENPESRFYHELRQMSAVTGPGAERMLGDATSRTKRVRAGEDINTVKLYQMAMTMCGMRINAGEWSKRTARQEKFRPFTKDSYSNGDMDFGILDRPIIPLTEDERLDLILKKESLATDWGRAEAGMDEDAITSMRNAEIAQRNAITGAQSAGNVVPFPGQIANPPGSPFVTG